MPFGSSSVKLLLHYASGFSSLARIHSRSRTLRTATPPPPRRYEKLKFMESVPDGISASPEDGNVFVWTASIFDDLGPYAGGYVPLRNTAGSNCEGWRDGGAFRDMHICRAPSLEPLVSCLPTGRADTHLPRGCF